MARKSELSFLRRFSFTVSALSEFASWTGGVSELLTVLPCPNLKGAAPPEGLLLLLFDEKEKGTGLPEGLLLLPLDEKEKGAGPSEGLPLLLLDEKEKEGVPFPDFPKETDAKGLLGVSLSLRLAASV